MACGWMGWLEETLRPAHFTFLPVSAERCTRCSSSRIRVGGLVYLLLEVVFVLIVEA
jgi:hypothetical protein